MAARRAIPERTRRPARAGLQTAAGSWRKLPFERADPGAAVEIARYLGNAYLETVARAGGGAAVAGQGCGLDAIAGDGGTRSATPPARLQTKLAVAGAWDALEREADRIADELMRRAAAGASTPTRDVGQTQEAEEPMRLSGPTSGGIEGSTPLAPEIAAQVVRMRAGGVPLSARERALFEPLLGVDLGAIRIHTGAAASQTARALNARAYAIGSDIAFGSGQYRPGTESGRWLLAHELVHTLQQRDARAGAGGPGTVQCKRGGGSIVIEEVRKVRGKWGLLTITHDIQWHMAYNYLVSGGIDSLILFIDVPRVARHGKPVSAIKVAAWSVSILVMQTGIKFKDGTGRAFTAHVAGDLQRYGFTGDENWIRHEYDINTLLEYIELQSLQGLRARFPADPTLDDFLEGRLEPLPVVAQYDYVDFTEKRKTADRERRLEQWAEGKEATIRRLIEKARKQKPPPRDLPDKVSARKGTKDWYLRVWVNYDRRGKKQATHMVRLREDESDAALFQRVRAATTEALFRDEDREKREREKEFPPWAKAKKRAVEDALAEQRRREKGARNFPDGVVLVAERQTAGPSPDEDAPAAPDTVAITRTSSEGGAPARVSEATVPLTTGATEAPSYIYLQVWVERGSGKGYQRNTGTVPLPLRPDTNVEELVRYIRTLASLLRQYERPPSGQPPAPSKSLETTLPSEQALRAFPALLAPTDLPEDGITVSGARNEFHMQLDYEDVYGGGENVDIYIASKLFSQYIKFYWKVYKVPAAFKQPETEGSSPDWPARLSYLYHRLNATKQPYPYARWENAKHFNTGADAVWSDDDTDSKMRVKFPEMDETKDPPEDFIVYCETRHGPIGDEDLKRTSSIAYYPVHVKPIKTVAKAAVSERTEKIKMIEAELKIVRAHLDPDKLEKEQLDETYQQVLLAIVQIKSDELEHLKALETKKPAEGIHAEIAFINRRLRLLSEVAKAREEGTKQRIAPSQLLKDQGRPDVLAMHLYLIAEHRDIETYTKQLTAQRERLTSSAKVAHTFKDDIKADSPHQYNTEAAMVSTLTGLVYPLRLIIAEAPDRRKRFRRGIAYTVIDATSPETQDQYQGDWPTADSVGHLKAIQIALDRFGDDATYGEGLIVVRIPPPAPAKQENDEAGSERTPNPIAAAHPGPKITDHESSPGPLQKVLWALSIIALAAGAFALSLTGAGAPAAVALLTLIAASAQAIGAIHAMGQRSRRHKLEWDAETALDIVSIVSVVPAGIGARLLQASALARTNPAAIPTWLQGVERAQRLLRIYGATEMGGSLYLIHEKLEDDIKKIESLARRMRLSAPEKRKLREQAFGNAILSGVMMVGGAVAARVGATVEPGPSSFVDRERLRQQADLLELEGLPRGYRSLQDRNVLDARGELTAAGRDFVDGIIPGASKRPPPTGTEPTTEQPPAMAPPPAGAPRPAGAPETVAPQPSRASAREAAETRARPVSRAAGAGDVETAATKGAPKRPPQKRQARAAEESGAGEGAAGAEPEGGTFKGAPKKRPAKREPSRQERRPVSGKKPTGPSAGPPPGPLPAPAGVALRTNQIWHFDGRDVVIVDTPQGPLAFYRRTGWGSLGEKRAGGAQKGDWAPFDGFVGGHMAKPEDLGEGNLRRWSNEGNRQIAEWLKSLNLPKGRDVREAWSDIQRSLEDAGVPVRDPLYGGRPVAPSTPPPEPPGPPRSLPPTAPGPPRPPAAPPTGGGGGAGAGGPTGVRPLHPVEAEYLARPGPIWSSPHEYQRSMIFDRNVYREAWRAAAGPDGGEPPPHGYLDHNRREIVVYRPRSDANVMRRPPPAPPSGPDSPPRPGGGSPGGTGSGPGRPGPAQAARDLPARPPAPRPPPAPDVAARPRDVMDPHGRIERSAGADRDQYYAREYFPDDVVVRGGAPTTEARYYVEARFEDGIIEMDFVLRRDDFPKATKGSFHRSGQLRGHEEFGRALDYFRGIHGEAAIKGIKGEWGGGDNLDSFNRAFRERLRGNRDQGELEQAIRDGRISEREWNEALKYAALRTKTGEWASAAKFSEVTIQDQSGFDRNTGGFDRIVVIFHKPGAGGSGRGGGHGAAPPPSGGSPAPAAPATPTSAGEVGSRGAPAFARPTPSATDPGPSLRPPRAPQEPGGPSSSGPPSRAGPDGGSGGRRGPGVRALTAKEAAGVRPEVGLVMGDWAVSRITSRELYHAAWRDATGRRGDPAPPHGFLDRDHRQIVVFEPPTSAKIVARPPARQAPRPPRPQLAPRGPMRHSGPGSPSRPGRPDLTSRPTRPDPAEAARDLPAGPRLPPRPPAPPRGGGGGGPGAGGPGGVRPLTAAQAAYFARPENILSSPREYDHRVIVDQDAYRAAWRATAGPQGGEPPPHGYLDQNRRAIVVYRPPADVQVVRTAPLHLPHETGRPNVRGGLLDWLWRRWRLLKPQLGAQLASGGDAGKLAYSRPGEIGVFEAILPDGRTVAVKIYPDEGGSGDANQRERFARELAAAAAASRTRSGPEFYGEVNVGRRRLGYAMERIEGDFAEAQPRTERELTDGERIAERLAQARITERTLQDVEFFGNELLAQGYYYDGEIQGLIDYGGRYRPIDFEKVRPLSRDPQIRAEQLRTHQERVSNEIADLRELRKPPEHDLPADLPVPEALRGLGYQRFGEAVIGWGHGVQDTNHLRRAIRADPQGERARLEANGLTLDMAKAWLVAYRHVDGQRHTAIFEARARLMAAIVKLLSR